MLLDTSGLLCFIHAAESQHADAVTFFRTAPWRLTHNYVIVELVALAQARGLPREPVLASSRSHAPACLAACLLQAGRQAWECRLDAQRPQPNLEGSGAEVTVSCAWLIAPAGCRQVGHSGADASYLLSAHPSLVRW